MDLAEAERRADLAERRMAETRDAWHAARTEDLHAQAALRNARHTAGLCRFCGSETVHSAEEHLRK